MAITSFKDLDVWQKAHQLVLETYKTTKGFPPNEQFGLTSQMRRAAVSIAANLAEGFKRRTAKDKANFYNIAQSSLKELHYYWILAKDLGYVLSNQSVIEQVDIIGRMLLGLVRATRREY
ncbi:MAG: four helix bundle protein [Elusimicrobia bacterium]|nr:four helix bundle protein [Elusimicrobiota bacterium]